MIQRHCRVTKRADGMSERYKPLSDAILDLLDQISAASAATGVVQEPLLADLESRWRAERPDDLAALTALLKDLRVKQNGKHQNGKRSMSARSSGTRNKPGT